MLAPLIVFAFTWAVVSGLRVPWFRLDRTSGALVGAVAMVLAGGLTVAEAWAAIHWDTIGLLLGMMILTAYLVEARLFAALAHATVTRAGSARALLWAVVFVAGGLSAILVNDTICVMFTPLVVAVVEAAELPALPFLLALASSTNIGGVVTFTGNPQNMIVGTHAGMSYAHYTLRMLPVGALGLVLDAALLTFLFRADLPRGPVRGPTTAPPTVDLPLLGISLATLVLVVAGFLLGFSLAGTALAGAAFLIVAARRPPRPVLARVDLSLLVFFAALFVVVQGVGHTGALARLATWLVPRLGGSPSSQLAGFSLLTVVGSNVFSNVPFVLLAIELVPRLADPPRGFIALAMASTLAGNLTIFGSVANLIVLELSGRHGEVGFLRFLRVGVVITTATMALGLAVLLGERALGW